jgi:hypothetical protein
LIVVAISPQSATIQAGALQKFQGGVYGTSDIGIVWSIQETGGGSIASDGTYTAPATAGAYHVVAKSHADPTKTSAATVTVTAPPATGGLVISSPLTVDKTAVVAGQTLNGTVTYQNTSASPISIRWVSLELRPPGATHVGGPFSNLAPQITTTQVIQPAGTLSLAGSRVFTAADAAGTWEAYASYQDASAVWHDGPSVNFTFGQSAGIAVTVTPSTPSSTPGGTINFQASVTGTTTGQSTAVTWSVQEAGGGTVSSTGVYTAPATTGTYHVVATSVADTSKKNSATVTVAPPPPIAVSVAPGVASVLPSGTATFTATVTGTTGVQSTAVTWSVQEAGGGTVSPAGVYVAPATMGTYHVVATSAADTTKTGTSTVTVSTRALIPPDRRTTWNPGLNSVGGIPNRTTIYKTLTPSGGDDTALIQAAIDSCPDNQVVMLAAGTFKINGGGLSIRRSNFTLRGTLDAAGKWLTTLTKADRATNPNSANIYLGFSPSDFAVSVNLAQPAAKGSSSVTLTSIPAGLAVGEFVLIDQVIGDSDPWFKWGNGHHDTAGHYYPDPAGSRRWFSRQDRPLTQIVEITAISGNTVSFNTPLHYDFAAGVGTFGPGSSGSQLSRYGKWDWFRNGGGPPVAPFNKWVGLEDLHVYGGQGGDGHGNISMSCSAYSWIKNVNAEYAIGTGISLNACFRCELRDSYSHETPDPNPGGAGYLTGMTSGTSDSLLENNVMWNGNKMIAMRATGGGNVIAYNYMEDGYGSAYKNMPEVGANAAHYIGPHMELLEGNMAWNSDSDAFWGSSPFITWARNFITTGARRNLTNIGLTDQFRRRAMSVNFYTYGHNFVGNVLGYPLMAPILPQVGFTYENNLLQDLLVPMWLLGYSDEALGVDARTLATTLRDGNWDWVTKAQQWHGVGGAMGTGTAAPIPNSLYLSSKPAFFGSNTWPWVDPTTGATYVLPAKTRFDTWAPSDHP